MHTRVRAYPTRACFHDVLARMGQFIRLASENVSVVGWIRHHRIW